MIRASRSFDEKWRQGKKESWSVITPPFTGYLQWPTRANNIIAYEHTIHSCWFRRVSIHLKGVQMGSLYKHKLRNTHTHTQRHITLRTLERDVDFLNL